MSKRIADILEADRPREKLLVRGAASLTDQELLAVLLGKGTTKIDVMTLAGKLARVIDEHGLNVKADDLKQFEGMGDAKAALILAAIEFARRRIKPEGAKIDTPADLLPHVRHYADRKQEHFLCATINGANDPYKSLKTTLRADIDEAAWESLHSDTSRPFPKPKTGRIAVKVINHLGDEVMKVFKI